MTTHLEHDSKDSPLQQKYMDNIPVKKTLTPVSKCLYRNMKMDPLDNVFEGKSLSILIGNLQFLVFSITEPVILNYEGNR